MKPIEKTFWYIHHETERTKRAPHPGRAVGRRAAGLAKARAAVAADSVCMGAAAGVYPRAVPDYSRRPRRASASWPNFEAAVVGHLVAGS